MTNAIMADVPSYTDTDHLAVRVPLQVMGLATAYAVALRYLERRYPMIKPDHTWAEVAGGVLISLIPVAIEARKSDRLNWRDYEGTVWRSFFASGTPIILWQLGEAVLRQKETWEYLRRARRSAAAYADDTTPLADRAGERADGSDPRSGRSGPSYPAGPELA